MAAVEPEVPTGAAATTTSAAAPKLFTKQTMKEKLLALQLKKNQARVTARAATEYETENKKMGGNALRKRERAAAKESHEKFIEALEANGEDAERYKRLHQPQASLDRVVKREKRKRKNESIDIFGEGMVFRAFKKRRDNTDFDAAAYQQQQADLGDDFYSEQASLTYGQATEDDPELVQSLVDEQKLLKDKRAASSRRRKWNEDDNVDFINERNRKFNKKVNRAFDKYTEEIRENLERGTAL